jgi:D-tyrosyl-tRNA(Tyr) deacylase
MRAVVQRVTSASVTVDANIVGRIASGLLVFVGVAHGDGPADLDYIAAKIRELRIFPDDHGRMNRSVADSRKGRRPSFDDAAPPALAESLYNGLVRKLRDGGLQVETGVFQAHMDVALVNDGPVTMLLDSGRIF